MKPFLKWAGGKRKLLPHIIPFLDEYYKKSKRYYEPFLGAGAVLFELEPKNAVVNDLNLDLIETYNVIKAYPNELIETLKRHQQEHSNDYYYFIRNLDRDKIRFQEMNTTERAARLIYLNKTCFNGLYRVNSKGEFNTPFGYYKNPVLFDESNILEISKYLNQNNITFKSEDFSEVVKSAKKGDFIYFDPPYDYNIEGFSKYQKEDFKRSDLERLKVVSDKLIKKGCIVLISNNATNFVLSLFNDENYSLYPIQYDIKQIDVMRTIGSSVNSRKSTKEVLILGTKKEYSISTNE